MMKPGPIGIVFSSPPIGPKLQHRSTVAYSTAKFGPAVTALEQAIRRGVFRRIPSPPPDTLKRMISAGRTAKGMPPGAIRWLADLP